MFEPDLIHPQGCLMVNSLYVKANGEMPCWDDVGEERILRKLDPDALVQGRELDLMRTPGLVAIRQSFIEDRLPVPGLCERCAVLGHGKASAVIPGRLEVLHIEPSYLCALSCPQCIPAGARRSLKSPPYYMSLDFHVALLRQLQREGIEHIRFVHFEGRGDPLTNAKLGEIVAATKEHYPACMTMITTHGNAQFKPWMVSSGVDVLRFSADGAFPETYAKYRVGGKFERVLDLMRAVRDNRNGTAPRVQWKFILFEWNDSDEELVRAAELASELKADLSFCFTHTPGRSVRYQDRETLRATLDRLGLDAGLDLTFQLKEQGAVDSREVVAELAQAHLQKARSAYKAAREHTAAADQFLASALKLDPGIDLNQRGGGDVLAGSIDVIAKQASASTLSMLANLAWEQAHFDSARRLFSAYLSTEPGDAASVSRTLRDMHHARIERLLERALSEQGRDGAECHLAVALDELVGPSPERVTDRLKNSTELTQRASPGALSLLANYAWRAGEHETAACLFRAYIAARGEHRDPAAETAALECALSAALARVRAGDLIGADRIHAEAGIIENQLPSGVPVTPGVISLLANVARERGDHPLAARMFDEYLLTDPPDAREAHAALMQSLIMASQTNRASQG